MVFPSGACDQLADSATHRKAAVLKGQALQTKSAFPFALTHKCAHADTYTRAHTHVHTHTYNRAGSTFFTVFFCKVLVFGKHGLFDMHLASCCRLLLPVDVCEALWLSVLTILTEPWPEDLEGKKGLGPYFLSYKFILYTSPHVSGTCSLALL